MTSEGRIVLGHCPTEVLTPMFCLHGGQQQSVQWGTCVARTDVTSPFLSLVFCLLVFQRLNRAVAETLAYLPMAREKALAFAMVTRSRLSASLPLSWWGRNQSRAKRITSGRLRSQAVCVSERGGHRGGSLERQAGSIAKALPLKTYSGCPFGVVSLVPRMVAI